MRRLALTGALVLVALVGAGNAQAHTNPTVDALLYDSGGSFRPEAMDELKRRMGSGDYTLQGTTQDANDVLEDSRRRSRLLPALRGLGVVALGVGAVNEIGWRFCLESSCPGSGWLYRKISTTAYGGSTTAVTGLAWRCVGTTDGCGEGTLSPVSGDVSTGWRFRSTQEGHPFLDTDAGTTVTAPISQSCLTGIGTASMETCAAAKAQTAVTWHRVVSGGSSHHYYVLRTEAQMSGNTRTHTITQAQYDALASKSSTGSYVPPVTQTQADLDAARDALGGTGPNTTAQEQAELDIAEAVDPGLGLRTLLQPQPNETYTAYKARLEAAGWLGTITTTQLAADLQGYGPHAVARVIYAVGTQTTVLDPLQWPSPAPSLDWQTDLTVRYNSNSAPEAPTEGGAGTPVTPPPTTVPTPGGVDFSPLAPIGEVCDKFPFGVVCWIGDQVGLIFGQPATPPAIFFDIPGFETDLVDFDLGEYGWDFAEWDVDEEIIFGPIRAALGFFLWLYGLWFLGTKLLGVRGADSGEQGLDLEELG